MRKADLVAAQGDCWWYALIGCLGLCIGCLPKSCTSASQGKCFSAPQGECVSSCSGSYIRRAEIPICPVWYKSGRLIRFLYHWVPIVRQQLVISITTWLTAQTHSNLSFFYLSAAHRRRRQECWPSTINHQRSRIFLTSSPAWELIPEVPYTA